MLPPRILISGGSFPRHFRESIAFYGLCDPSPELENIYDIHWGCSFRIYTMQSVRCLVFWRAIKDAILNNRCGAIDICSRYHLEDWWSPTILDDFFIPALSTAATLIEADSYAAWAYYECGYRGGTGVKREDIPSLLLESNLSSDRLFIADQFLARSLRFPVSFDIFFSTFHKHLNSKP